MTDLSLTKTYKEGSEESWAAKAAKPLDGSYDYYLKLVGAQTEARSGHDVGERSIDAGANGLPVFVHTYRDNKPIYVVSTTGQAVHMTTQSKRPERTRTTERMAKGNKVVIGVSPTPITNPADQAAVLWRIAHNPAGSIQIVDRAGHTLKVSDVTAKSLGVA